jgi:hypothetical protein
MYHSYKDRVDNNKNCNNELVAKCSINFLGDTIANILAFDGEHNYSSKTFTKYAIGNRQTIFVPERDSDSYQNQKNNNLCTPYDGLMSDFIFHHSDIVRYTNVIYYDSMNCITGNIEKNIYPLDDISNILKLTKHTKIVLAYTFATRSPKSKFNSVKSMIDKNLKSCVNWNQFKIVTSSSHPSETYKRSVIEGYKKTVACTMCFGILCLEKDLKINPNNVTFESYKDGGGFVGYLPKEEYKVVPYNDKTFYDDLKIDVP